MQISGIFCLAFKARHLIVTSVRAMAKARVSKATYLTENENKHSFIHSFIHAIYQDSGPERIIGLISIRKLVWRRESFQAFRVRFWVGFGVWLVRASNKVNSFVWFRFVLVRFSLLTLNPWIYCLRK